MTYVQDQTTKIWFWVKKTPFGLGLFLHPDAEAVPARACLAWFPGQPIGEVDLETHPWKRDYLIQFRRQHWGPAEESASEVQHPAYRANAPSTLFKQKPNAKIMNYSRLSCPKLVATATIQPGEQIVVTYGSSYTRRLNSNIKKQRVPLGRPHKHLDLCPMCGQFILKNKKRSHRMAHRNKREV